MELIKCPKCGSGPVDRKFRHPDPLFAMDYENPIKRGSMRARITPSYGGSGFTGDWVNVEARRGYWKYLCLNCGFSWTEKPSLLEK